MKINRIIVMSVIGLMTSAATFAGNGNMPDKNEVKDFCSVVSKYDNTSDCRQFLHFVTTLRPELNNEKGRNTLTKIHQLINKKNNGGGGMPGFDPEIIEQIMQLLKELGITEGNFMDLIEYVKKVYPLYVFQMQNRISPELDLNNQLAVDTIFQAPVDEAYYGLADPNNKYVPAGLSKEELEEMEQNGGIGKRNGSYVWGMGTYKDKLFWSTNNNYLCMQGYGNFVQPGVGDNTPYENKCWACEYGQSAYAKEAYKEGDDNSKYADIRPPRMYSYDTKSGIVTDITPSMDEYPILKNCQGLRSCGIHNGVVFFGGPGLYASDWDSKVSAAFVAYDADNDRILSANSMDDVDG